MHNSKKAIALAAMLMVMPLSACSGEEDNTIKVSEVTHSVFYTPLYLADALGYFKEENITLSLSNGGGADSVMSALLSGEADIGFCGPEAAVYVAAGGSSDTPVSIGQLTKRDGSFLVSREKEENFSYKNLEGKEILAGRKGGVPAMTFAYVLKNNGLKDGENVKLNFDVAFNLMVSAFEAGTADYCTMFEPTASDYEKAGKGYIVSSVGEASGEIPYTCFIAKKSWIKANEKKAEGFINAVTRATKYAVEHSPNDVATLISPYFTGTEISSLSSSVENYVKIDAWTDNMSMKEESYNRLLAVMEYSGELPKKIPLKDISDNTFAEKAYKKYYE